MVWQDTALFLGTLVFIITFIPFIRAKEKPPLRTSIPTAIVIYAFVYIHITLSLFLTAFVTLIMAIGWTILAIQKFRQNR